MNLSKHIKIIPIKEGIALFNSFSGDTHFSSIPLSFIIKSLYQEDKSKEQLLALYSDEHQLIATEIKEQFYQVITQAIKSDIILEN
ncbi:MAG: hypothetical protein ACSHW0_15720 [Thalassotalea sp.]